MPIQFLKNVQSEENNLLSNRREPISLPSKAEPDKPYVFTATYRTPWETTIRDECVLDFHIPADFVPETAPAP